MKLYYRQTGETGTPIIILHGVFGSSDNWLTISKSIAEHNHRVFLVDQRNHGRSPRSEVFNYNAMASDLQEFITEHQLEQPVVIGHSMGGKTVMQFAMDYPGQFSRLVIVDIAPKYYPVHHAELIRGLKTIDLTAIKSRNEADDILSQFEPILPVRQFLLKNLFRTDDGQFDWRLNLPVIEQELDAIGGELTHVRNVTEPTLFIRGAKSHYIKDEDEAEIKRIFPNSTLETIEDAGHWLQAEKPVEFVEILMRFLGDELRVKS